MKTSLLKGLAQLASRDYHYDYIVNGTKDEYVVPEELLDTVRGRIAGALREPNGITQQQYDDLTALDALAKKAYDAVFDYGRDSLSTMVDSYEWSAMRELANRLLRDSGIQERDLKGLLMDA